MRKRANVLIIDLDNTIFDWFEMWFATFLPLYDALKSKLCLEDDELQSAIRKVHQEKRTSEYTFLIDELPAVTQKYKPDEIRDEFASAFLASKQARDRALKLYPSVLQTLWDLKKRGTLIVAYTESHTFYSGYRLKRFGLDGVIDFLYSPEDNDVPEGVSLEKVRNSPDDFYELQITKVRHTPKGEIKPNRKILLDVLKDIGSSPEACVYIGDSLFKDVAMAQDVGVNDVFAEYGVVHQKPEYDLLRKVSHWTDADVEREKAVSKREVTPSYTIQNFGEITSLFDFFAYKPKSPDDEKLKIIVDIWKQSVTVQQHFNDIEMRIRNFAITVIGALVTALGFSYQKNVSVSVFGLHFSSSMAIVFFAALAWCGFYFMDRFWYHKLLKGAVDHASAIEERYQDELPELSLGRGISKSSPLKLCGFTIGSNQKITIFYFLGLLGILAIGTAILFSQPATKDSQAQEQKILQKQ